MLMLPIPTFAGLILIWLALRAALDRRRLLALFLTACALQSVGITLAAGYGVAALRPILPVTAAMIPPLAWITFRAGLFGQLGIGQAAIHLTGPAFVLFCRLFAPETVDSAVAAVFVFYGAAILMRLRRAGDLPLARLEAGSAPGLIWQGVGWALIVSALSDLLIWAAWAAGRADLAGLVISLGSSLSLLALGLLSILPAAKGEDIPEPAPPQPEPPAEEDSDILARLDDLLARDQAHLDPNLTLARLARRLRVPDKRLSAAVNRATGGNVSRHINGWRIRHACALIEGGASVTQAMLDSGFNTKSNFNREFLRVTGTTPSQWKARDQS
ncbi:MAG: AraC family transcriptional regulator [Paracoccus sp. (in: a-proteobacteria)]|uniref:helix-turn-helix domain-containing protein n=1 Tax=Paracoccus sp. TaxID=267 RepID=UPI0026DF0852|nr:AraC family transcriptional regulator [Paracoccus sp. (in: a-proteobacteria)]MDO5632332.1 AraC family transcriptional regulator [Paracoccus sp. (in: a-proteobacteria)]